jgi:hypothetical protein
MVKKGYVEAHCLQGGEVMYHKDYTDYTVQTDDRLLDVNVECQLAYRALRDAEWDGMDTTALRQRYKSLTDKLLMGVTYEPRF